MYSKGAAKERELVLMFDKANWGAIRIPKSGGRTKKPLPDVITSNGDITYAFECKSSRKNIIYIKKKQIENLNLFSNKFGAIPMIAVKFAYHEWNFFKTSEFKNTDKKYIPISSSMKGKSFQDILSI